MNKKFTVKKQIEMLSDWVSLVRRDVSDGKKTEVYHSIHQNDYVSVLGVTDDNSILMVKQYRPAVDKYTLELPGGLLDISDENPGECARREIFEETGHASGSQTISLGCWLPDTGRLENRLWAFFLDHLVFEENWESEPDVQVVKASPAELLRLIETGEFDHALHIAIIGMAFLRGYLSNKCRQ